MKGKPRGAGNVVNIGRRRARARPNKIEYGDRDTVLRWGREGRDPVLQEIAQLIATSGLDVGEIIERVLDVSDNKVHMSYSTISNWLNGKTRRPQNYTVTWVALALGYRRKWTKVNGGE